jgi:ATP-dependent Clp protease adaptor protein ClpS
MRAMERTDFATKLVAPDGEDDDGLGGDVAVEDKPKIRKARRWAVVFYNDDYTTKWFVVMVLQEYFRMGQDAATAFMMAVHRNGKGAAAFYTRDIAETKAAQVAERAKEFGMPLKVEAEPEDDGEDDRDS